MTTQAKIGYGSLFQVLGVESPEDWETVGEVTSITPPNLARDTVDATHMQSADGYREFIPGLRDGGEVAIEHNYIPGHASTTTLLAHYNADTVGTYRIVYPDGADLEFQGILTAHEPEAPLEGKMMATTTFKVTGKPVLTQVS